MSNPNPPQYQPQQPQPAQQQQQPAYAQQQPAYSQQQHAYAQQSAPIAPAHTVRPSLPTTVAQTNAMALVAIILGFMQPIAGIVFGHIALSQIKRNGDAGRGMAMTALIIGYVYTAMLILFIIVYVGIIFTMIASIGAMSSSYSYGL